MNARETGTHRRHRGSAHSPRADDSSPPLPPAFEAYGEQPLAQAPAAGPGKNGLLELVLAREGHGPTRLLSDRTRVPYHLTGTLSSDPAPGVTTLIAQEPTGGVAQGDRHRVDVEVRAGARAHLATQGATKVHSMHTDYGHLDATFCVGPGAHLEYIPGPTILNESARCLQTTTVDLAPDAVAILGDVVVADGLSHHEAFSFDHYRARLEARRGDDLVCADVVDLRPSERDPRGPASVGPYDVVGTLYAFVPDSTADAETLTDQIHERLAAAYDDGFDDGPPPVHAGVSTLPADAGVVCRVLGHRGADVTDAIRLAWEQVRRATLGVGLGPDRRY
ncbi:urease accessory protein UreD [Natronobiforma cellulositropha]|uniref:urease accessory protein UreD n=1 Tax=Natronobiforma cellulositropha TaxID=1679076 RepID=UPI0021D57D3C|nr:urease accessory protein UreD [Natronobiforma cellulositropha]